MAGRASNRRTQQRLETRNELIEAAHALVRQGGYEELTIRKLAARVGYAPMSVYSYFPDKHAILLALAQVAFANLARRMERRTEADPLAALRQLLCEYVAFGLENPNEYRTVFMTVDPGGGADGRADAIHKDNPALGLLLERVRACVDAGSFAGDVFAIATLLWTVSHGAVALLISFPDYPFGDRAAYVERVVAMAMTGLRAHPAAALAGAANR